MFLKANKRIKDGKVHYYWMLVESVHADWRVSLYLGELNDSQRAEWRRESECP